MSLEQKIQESYQLLKNYKGIGLAEYVFENPIIQQTVDEISYLITVNNSYTNNHPVDDLIEVFKNPNLYEHFLYENIEISDARLEEFIRPSVVAIIALMGTYNENNYQATVDKILTDDICDYLAAYGRGLGSYGYDDAYVVLKELL